MLDRMKLGATATDPAQPVDRRKHVRPKYRHPDTGQTWAGRGSRPLWLRAELERGADLKDFRIPSETT
jgi:DNA-binding protein H-NS